MTTERRFAAGMRETETDYGAGVRHPGCSTAGYVYGVGPRIVT